MTRYENPWTRNTLGVDHTDGGETVLTIYPPGEMTMPQGYPIPSAQLPSVLFDMTGGEATQAEQEAAQNFLDGAIANGATTEDLISSVRNTVLALCIHEEAQYAAETPEVDELDGMGLEELRNAAKALREQNTTLLRGRDTVISQLNQTKAELAELRNVLQSIHGALGKWAEGQTNAA